MEENNKSEIKEKSNFEKSIIEAFKQTKVSDIYEKLGISLSELPLYIDEVKTKNNKINNPNFILNLNILDKLSRIIERKFININILITKIFITLLTEENFKLLSDNSSILINLSNQIISLLEEIKYTDNYYELIKKIYKLHGIFIRKFFQIFIKRANQNNHQFTKSIKFKINQQRFH